MSAPTKDERFAIWGDDGARQVLTKGCTWLFKKGAENG